MKFKVPKKDILFELQLLQGIVEKRNTMPILANILINATEKELELTGTDLEVGLKTHIPAKIEEQGTITISGKKIFEIVKSLPEKNEIAFQDDKDLKMEITSGESVFRVNCLPKEDYPQVPEPKFEKQVTLPLKKFQEMIDCVYCAITQEQRYYLNGALMILKGDSIELVSTDGHRLAYTQEKIDGLNVTEEIKSIVSKKTLAELRKLEDEELEFDLDDNNLFFKVQNRTLISRIIEGKFPNYDAVIPKDNPNHLSIEKNTLMDAIRRVSLLSTERSKGVKLFIDKNELKLFSSNPEMGEARDRLAVDYQGDKMEVGFNSQYILDFLATVETEQVKLELKDENSAILMKPEKEEESVYLYVLMPMKI